MKSITKILNDRDKILFEKALKFYFYTRQQDVRKLNSEIRKRFAYAGQIAYSLIITYIREGSLKLEYMDFLNEELKTMQGLDSKYLDELMIKPHEIDEIEFQKEITIKVFDEDANSDLIITYDPDSGTAKQSPANH